MFTTVRRAVAHLVRAMRVILIRLRSRYIQQSCAASTPAHSNLVFRAQQNLLANTFKHPPQTRSSTNNLTLVTTAGTTTTSLFELATLGLHVRLGVRIRNTRSTEVLVDFTRVLRTAEEHDALTRRRAKRELIKRHALATRLDNARARGLRESERAHLQRWNVVKAHIISHRTHNRRDLALLALHELGQFRQGQRRAVHLRHEQSLQHRLVKLRIRATSQESVQLFRANEKTPSARVSRVRVRARA